MPFLPVLLSLGLASLAAAPVPPDLPAGMKCLLEAYPEHLCSGTATELVWCDGTRMPWDDGRADKDHAAKLANGDLEDQQSQRYPLGKRFPHPAVDHDPGRIRYEPFFRKMYGDSARQVRKRMARVRWLPRSVGATVWVTTVNDVHKKLQAVSDELDRLPRRVREPIHKHGGTFNWRVIGGTKRLSMHSFAVAIDVGVKHSNYWRWSKPVKGRYPYKNRIPLEVVEVFEKHGFIWGGKWYHYDTMHFEYRPELLHPSCASPAADDSTE